MMTEDESEQQSLTLACYHIKDGSRSITKEVLIGTQAARVSLYSWK